jgi:hypothetical protein
VSEENKENKTTPQAELTEQEIQAKLKEMRAAVSAFAADPQHDRYQPCEANKTMLEEYLKSHNLELSAESLHLAFVDLSKAGRLVLYEESKLAPPEPPKQPDKEKLPPIGDATANDLGVGFKEQQHARKNVQGVVPASNRDALIRAAQRTVNQRISGGRFHL